MKTMKRMAVFALVLCMLATVVLPQLSIEADAATYVVGNGVTIPNANVPADGSNKYCQCGFSIGTAGHWCCWWYGYYVYYYIWGVYPNRYENSTHYLRTLSAAERSLTADHLKLYLINAKPGALLRIDRDPTPSAGDNNGHTLVFVQMNKAGDGAVFLEGNYDNCGRSRLVEWKFNNLIAQYGPGTGYNYQYIKYISWPNAPEYTKESVPVAAYDGLIADEDGIYVHGWAFDPDTVSEYVSIQVYLNGEYWKTIVANTSRPDVHAAHGCGENHGFAFDIPITEAGTYSVHLYAVNTTAGAANLDMGAKEITITHTHSYTKKIIKQANCTKTGVITYTCQGCQSAYTEDIPALGHNYTSQKVDATCTTQEHTKYTCTRCGDTYVEYLGAWSQWSTEYPTGVPEDRIEAKTQYSYRQKEYKTSNQNTLQGWTKYGTTYSDWSASKTTTTKPAEGDLLQITKTAQTGWGYYHYCNYYSGCWNVDSIAYGSGNYYHSCATNFEIPASYIADQGGRQSYGGTGSGAPACGYNFYYWFRNPSADVYTYTYQTREKINQFYRWSGWSSWSDEKVTSSEDREVKTRTVYRYKADGLADHSYSDACDTTCNICGATRKAEHIYIGDCNTKCKNCGATRTAIGKHTFAGGAVCLYCDVTFGDVSATSWQVGPVVYAYDKGLMAGKGTDANGNIKFDPNSPITREEFVQVLYNAEGKPSVSIANKFPDVKDAWYKNAVLWANKNNIANGMGNGNFGVGMNITRQDLAMMLYKYAKLKGCSLAAEEGRINQFADGDKVADYAKNAMNWAVTNGVLSGKGTAGKPLSTFRLDPAGTATRAECAAMLKNFMTAFGL